MKMFILQEDVYPASYNETDKVVQAARPVQWEYKCITSL